ncbi:MAG: SWIM zinc finger family protein [Nitrospinae bacterium]|nr:SWIM zinc finger family protein [Nitrospinota bacterium]
MPIPVITKEIIHSLASRSSLDKGYEYYECGAVKKVWIEGDSYNASVEGSELYKVTISERNGEIMTSCSCPYDWGGICKHVVAAMLYICSDNTIKEYKKDIEDINALIEKVDVYRLKKFLLNILNSNDEILKDFKIFTRGKRETEKTVEGYKDEILSLFEGLKGKEYYYDDYYNEYEPPVSEIIDKFTETAEKYTGQENYREAIKIYRGIFEACIEGLRNNNLEDFADDIHYHAEKSLHAMADNIGEFSLPLKDKRVYLDYLLHSYNNFSETAVFEDVFSKVIDTAKDAIYILNNPDAKLSPIIKLNLLITNGEFDEVISFGERHYTEHPSMAIPLSNFYLKHNRPEKAVSASEKAIEVIQKKGKDFYYYHEVRNTLKGLREILDKNYRMDEDYPKIIENLIMLIKFESDIAYYKRLRGIIKTRQERDEVVDRLSKIIAQDYDLLFNIYALEDDYERLLSLANRCLEFDTFHQVVNKIKEKYPEECFELYKRKINKTVKDVKKREVYRQIAYWLKLMKKIPGTEDKFKKYVEHLRENYRRRPAFIQEIKGI